ncbi:Alpha-amylase precursor [Mannheimia haemolytica]|uniref:Alpha-amylase n=1 Tax=Mannheimia haemolytica TaxID=75985 RepID=A0A378NFM8_MANHA|nr:Alpha-amylase precursor [Mannheimia haemolytica]
MKNALPYLCLFYTSSLFAQSWQHSHFSDFNDDLEKHFFQSQVQLEKGSYPLRFKFGEQCYQPQQAIKLNQSVALVPCINEAPQLRLFRQGNYLAQIDLRSGTPTLTISVEQQLQHNEAMFQSCPNWDKKPIEIDVSSTFAEGESVSDFYSGNTAIVKNGKVTLMPNENASGLILLEKAIPKIRQRLIGKMPPSILC